MPLHLFLDLESTVIDPVTEGWANTRLLNTAKVKKFISENNPDFVHIFSFAIWNQEEKRRFCLFTQPQLERHFGKLTLIPTVDDDMIAATMMDITRHELMSIIGKQEAFRLFLRHIHKLNSTSLEIVLLDDAVYNESFEWPDLKISGRILNIDQMEDIHGNIDSQDRTILSAGQRYRTGW